MMSRAFAVVTTRLPPQICGVGAFSWYLQRALAQPALFLVKNGAYESRDLGVPIVDHRCEETRLAWELEQAAIQDVLLHYAGRAYHRWQAPFWLVRVLQKWKTAASGRRLIVYFHELPATLPMTTRHFIPNRLNGVVVQRLARLADVVVTNTAEHAITLQHSSQRHDIRILPVGPNIEPAKTILPSPRKQGRFVVLGLPFARDQVIRQFYSLLLEWIQTGVLTSLDLIGPQDTKYAAVEDRLLAAPSLADVTTRHGPLPEAQISVILTQAQFALSGVTEKTWSKSSVFVSCAAHRCPIIAELPGIPPLNGCVLPREVSSISVKECERRAEQLYRWYETNASWSVIAKEFERLLNSSAA